LVCLGDTVGFPPLPLLAITTPPGGCCCWELLLGPLTCVFGTLGLLPVVEGAEDAAAGGGGPGS